MGKKPKQRPEKKPKRSEMINVDRTLTELEKDDWGEPGYLSSLVVNCHALRKKPLRDFDASDFRLMIGQKISLEYLVPLAVPILESYAFVEGGYYPGDLLLNVLLVEKSFWEANRELWERVRQLCIEQGVREAWDQRWPKNVPLVDAFDSMFEQPKS